MVKELRGCALFLIDAERRIASWNAGVEQILGYSEPDFAGKPAEILFTQEDVVRNVPQQELDRAAREGRAPGERWHVREDGSPVYCESILTALKDEQSKLLGYSVFIRDITEEQSVREKSDALAHALDLTPTVIREPDGTILTWSTGAAALYGWSKQEAEGKRSHDLFSTEFPEPLERIEAKLQRDGHWEGELRHLRKDGTSLVVASHWVFRRDHDGEPINVIEVNNDVTERIRVGAERQGLLVEREQRAAELDAILRSIPDAVYVGDENGIRESNELGVRMLGFRGIEDLQQHIGVLAERIQTRLVRTGEIIGFEDQPFTRALRGEPCVEEVITRRVDTGEEVIVRCAAAPIRHNGRIRGAVAINTDITQQKRIEHERERLLAALQRSNEELSQFAHVVSHDLQTPLRMVNNYAQLLERRYKGKLDETGNEFIRTITDGAATMAELIRGLLQIAQVGEGSNERTPIRVRTVVDGVLATLRADIEETGAEVSCGELPTVDADRLLLLQLFQNLIGNALKYRDPKRAPRIQITSERLATEYLFSVADNGLGIPERQLNRIFAPFKRLHGAEIAGTGLGLAVCKRIVERHGGRIWAESEPGKGSRFCFTIPRRI